MFAHIRSRMSRLWAGLRALWKAPDWGLKLLAFAYELRRFHREGSRDAR